VTGRGWWPGTGRRGRRLQPAADQDRTCRGPSRRDGSCEAHSAAPPAATKRALAGHADGQDSQADQRRAPVAADRAGRGGRGAERCGACRSRQHARGTGSGHRRGDVARAHCPPRPGPKPSRLRAPPYQAALVLTEWGAAAAFSGRPFRFIPPARHEPARKQQARMCLGSPMAHPRYWSGAGRPPGRSAAVASNGGGGAAGSAATGRPGSRSAATG